MRRWIWLYGTAVCIWLLYVNHVGWSLTFGGKRGPAGPGTRWGGIGHK